MLCIFQRAKIGLNCKKAFNKNKLVVSDLDIKYEVPLYFLKQYLSKMNMLN